MLKVQKIAKPKGLPYPLDKVKDHLRLTSDDISGLGEDGLIAAYITAATDFIYTETWEVLQSTDFKGYLDDWEDFYIYRGPVTEVTSIKYYDVDGTLITMTNNVDYETDLSGKHVRVCFNNKPTLRDRNFNNIEVEFKAGYTDFRNIPDDFVAALMLIASDFYEVRQSTSVGVSTTPFEVPASVKAILANNSRRVFT